MVRIGVRELRQNASRYLDLVKHGQTVEVTERGKLVARLVPPTWGETAREELIAGGHLVPAAQPFRLPHPAPLPEGSSSTDDVLEELREERL